MYSYLLSYPVTTLRLFSSCSVGWMGGGQTVGYVVVGHDIPIGTAPSSFDVTWAVWKKNYFLPEQGMKLRWSGYIQEAPQCRVVHCIHCHPVCPKRLSEHKHTIGLHLLLFWAVWHVSAQSLLPWVLGWINKTTFHLQWPCKEGTLVLTSNSAVCARFMSSGMWCCVTGQGVPDVLTAPCRTVSERRELPTQWHGGTSQKTDWMYERKDSTCIQLFASFRHICLFVYVTFQIIWDYAGNFQVSISLEKTYWILSHEYVG